MRSSASTTSCVATPTGSPVLATSPWPSTSSARVAPHDAGSTMTAMIRGHGRAFARHRAPGDYLAGSRDAPARSASSGLHGRWLRAAQRRDGYAAAAVNYGQLPRQLDKRYRACPIVASYGAATVASRCRRPARRSTGGGGSNPRRQGIPCGQPRLPQRHRNRPPVLRPLLRVAAIGPEPESAKDAWDRIERILATRLN